VIELKPLARAAVNASTGVSPPNLAANVLRDRLALSSLRDYAFLHLGRRAAQFDVRFDKDRVIIGANVQIATGGMGCQVVAGAVVGPFPTRCSYGSG